MKHRLGRWEVTLRPSVTSKGLLLEQTSALDCLLGTIGTMLATYPLCKTLGIYTDDDRMESLPSDHKLLKRIHNDQGIRVSELMDAL
jgi:hypothetical protein